MITRAKSGRLLSAIALGGAHAVSYTESYRRNRSDSSVRKIVELFATHAEDTLIAAHPEAACVIIKDLENSIAE